MYVEITAIEQRYSMRDQRTISHVIVTLPSGRNLTVEVTEEEAVAIIEANALNNTGTIEHTRVQEEDSVSFETDTSLQEDTIDWMQIDDEVLLPIVKAEFMRRQLPQYLHVALVAKLAKEVIDSLAAFDEPEEAGIGVVERNVRLPGRERQQRRIESDEAGNPVVPSAVQPDHDPGEIVDAETGLRSI